MMMATTTTTNTEENQSRDAYGFAISKENKQPKDWKEVLRKEEEERQVAWYEFLRRGEDGMTPPTHAKRKMKYNEDNEEEKDDNEFRSKPVFQCDLGRRRVKESKNIFRRPTADAADPDCRC